MYPIEGSDVRDLARAIENYASAKKEENELKENELATEARKVFALEKANEIEEKKIEMEKNFRERELELYTREVFALDKANKLKELDITE